MSSPRVASTRKSRLLLREEVSDRIKRYILEHKLRPGDPLPTEHELGETLDASRSSIREAIKTLAALDIVEVRHGHGTYVGRLSLAALVEGLTFRGLLSPTDDFRVLAELVDVRELFERGMAARIVPALDAEHLDALDAAVAEMADRVGTGQDFAEVDRAFHALLVEPLGNELIGELSSACWDVYAIVAPELNVLTEQDEREIVAAHRAIVRAARSGDVDRFERAITKHYAPVRRRIAAARTRETS